MKDITTRRTFGRSGIHPPQMKGSGRARAIADMPLPRHVEISMSQSLGRPANPVVKPGDHVRRYELIGEAQGPVSANVHTPISGTVKSVGAIATADGHGALGVVIEADGNDHAADLQCIRDACPIPADKISRLSPEEIIGKIRDAGIVGLGGATFPTATKLSPPPGTRCEYLLINGAECEPFLTCDDSIMCEMPGEIITGVELIMKALGNGVKCIIGIEENKPEAIDCITKACRGNDSILVATMKTHYPQGAEKMLAKTLTGREIAPGELPISQGIIIQNVGTALAVYHAIVWGIPLVERVMTIGDYHGTNLRVPIGTSLNEILSCEELVFNDNPNDAVKIINGGPMMGRALAGIQGSSTKGMSGLLLFFGNEAPIYEPTPCVRCARCVQACPMGLEPYLIARLAELGETEDAKSHHILDCMECGCCSYTCIAHRRLVDWIKVGKALARKR